MLNQLVLVGRIAGEFVDGKIDGQVVKQVKLAIPRSYKNEDGEYDTDILPIILRGNIGSNTYQFCKKGDIIGVKGAVLTTKNKQIYICAEKVTFLSSKANQEEN